MDLSELLNHQNSEGVVERRHGESRPPRPVHELTGQLGAEVAGPLSDALARIDAVLMTGRLDRAGLQALRADIDMARRSAIVGQQIHRFAAATVRPHHEQIELGQVLREALLQRTSQSEAQGLEIRQLIKPAQVVADAPLLFSLLQAVLDWSFEHARSMIEFRLEVKTWPVHAFLSCRFAHQPADEAEEEGADATRYIARRLDTMTWHLVQRAAQELEVVVVRQDTPVSTLLTLEFPRTVNEMMLGERPAETDSIVIEPASGVRSALSHVLVLAARREVRNQVREALRTMDLMLDCANDLDEAREFSAAAAPQAVVYDAALGGDRFDAWRQALLARAPQTVFIQIGEGGPGLEISTVAGRQVTRVGLDAIGKTLPPALSFELQRAARG